MSNFKKVGVASLVVLVALVFNVIHPPPPRKCSTPGGPPSTNRIELRDGRHLVYREYGVPKEVAKYKVVLVHSLGASKYEASLLTSPAVEELGVYLVSFDRPGYGKSDPNPKQTFKSLAFDIEELADQLGLGNKFYVIGLSMGGHLIWGCLKYIPQRLAGAALLAPTINFWWPGFPEKLMKEAYNKQLLQDQRLYRVAYYAPWLMYWWNTQKWFPCASVINANWQASKQDLEIYSKLDEMLLHEAYVTQQGEFESLHRDLIIGFGKPEFDPMDMENPFPNNEGNVHLWHGDDDGLVPVELQSFIAKKLPWIKYREVQGGGHIFPYGDYIVRDDIWKTFLNGKK
ncbi:unnamed protein product [Withania somnifera]